jgi:phenylacetate-coenzyme A ligase PaaK-like adenylate-forming protein
MTIAKWLPRFREAYRSIGELAGRETWSRADIERHQLTRLNAIWRHAIERVPHYRDLASQQRLPGQFGSLDEFIHSVPLLHKAPVRDQPERLLSIDAGRGGWSLTSGSTGMCTRVFWTNEDHREVLRGRYRFLAAWGVDIFDRSIMLWGDRTELMRLHRRIPARVAEVVQDRLRHRLRLSTRRLDRATLRSHLRRIVRFQPAVLYAYSMAAHLLAREALASGFRCESLKLVVLSAEVAEPHMIATVERAFGVPTVMEYGSIECGFLGGEYPDRLLRVRDDCALVETLPRPDGRFDIVVTGLVNSAFPLLRYLIGDTTDAPRQVPVRGLSVLHRISGRQSDFLLKAGGGLVHSSPVAHAVESDPAVRRFLVRQRADGSVHVLVETDATNTAIDVASIMRHLESLVGFPVTLQQVTDLPSTTALKHRSVVSDCADWIGG